MDALLSTEAKLDVVVIGAGPAGSAAAIGCARRGLQTLLIDAKSFPRRKVCGGCMNLVAIDLLQQLIGAEHTLWQRACQVENYHLIHAKRCFSFALPGGVAIERSELDDELVKQAVGQGVIFHAPATARIDSVDAHEARVTIRMQNRQVGIVRASAVVVAGGLGTQAWSSDLPLKVVQSKRSRVGVAATLADVPAAYAEPGIYMAVDDAGYVGLTPVADGRLHLAAAVDVSALQRLGPQELTKSILARSGAASLNLEAVTWRGTPSLTSRANRFACQRVFLVGDAAGYVEPFTGEGIRWALASGSGVAAYVDQAVRNSPVAAATAWDAWYRRHIVRDQRLCQAITRGLRSRTLRWLAHHVLSWQPAVVRPIIHGLNSSTLLASPASA